MDERAGLELSAASPSTRRSSLAPSALDGSTERPTTTSSRSTCPFPQSGPRSPSTRSASSSPRPSSS